MIKREAVGVLISLVFGGAILLPAQAYPDYRGYATHVRCGYDRWAYEHPKAKTAAVDGAVGAAAGALLGAVTGRGALHGALVGAGAGAGIGLISTSRTMAYHPVAKTASEVGVGALGLFLAAHHGHQY